MPKKDTCFEIPNAVTKLRILAKPDALAPQCFYNLQSLFLRQRE